ncbi:MAG: hypothetical protein WBA45_06960 [Microthrixaceae bacterium]
MTVVRVLPDVPAVDRAFDYTSEQPLDVGTLVRVPFSGRQVRAWVLEVDVDPPAGIALRPISKVLGVGPDSETIELCRWAAWRWGGRLATMLRVATHDRLVKAVPTIRVRPARPTGAGPAGAGPAGAGPAGGGPAYSGPAWATGGGAGPAGGESGPSALEEIAASLILLGPGAHVLQASPTSDSLQVALAAAATGQALVITPSIAEGDRLARGLRKRGAAVARWSSDWAAAAGGATVVGGRTAAFAPMPALSAVVVIDEHDELLQSESSPTWNAREVAVERARRAGVPCLLMSPCPSLEAFTAQSGAPIADDDVAMVDDFLEPRGRLPRGSTREGWAPLVVIDRRGEDTGRSGLFSNQLVGLMKETLARKSSVICVLNRTGRARLLACRSCSTVAACAECGAAVYQNDQGELVCMRCGAVRPAICVECGSTALALLRVGVTRAREELEALLRVPVASITARERDPQGLDQVPVLIGTRAVLNRRHRAGLVAFLDIDQELLAPRYRAAEEAFGMLATASRQVGGRSGGIVAVQTHFPEHEAVQAAVRADPRLVSRVELARRRLLGFPPLASIAVLGYEAAPEFIERLGSPDGVAVADSGDGEWLVRSRHAGRLQDALQSVDRPPGRLKLQVDPIRLSR